MQSSRSRTIQTVYDYSRANIWEWFLTWTTSKTKIDRYDYEEITKKLTQWLNNVRKRKAPNLKYIIVPERHKDGAWHFHGLLSNTGDLTFTEAINAKTGGKMIIKGMQVYNLPDWKLGHTTATQIKDTLRASNYITKYITKDLIYHTKGQKRYWNSRNLEVGQVEKDLIDNSIMEQIHDLYMPAANRHKKIVVEKSDYQQEINIITLGTRQEP